MCILHACLQILLVTEQGLVLEGTQTNFFAVVDDTVYTAEEGVLMGTVRGVVLEVGFKGTCRTVCTENQNRLSCSFCLEKVMTEL
jgi:branched-subunit amino acid aminotransferase/4-amino-4-deoxychorismate lyase